MLPRALSNERAQAHACTRSPRSGKAQKGWPSSEIVLTPTSHAAHEWFAAHLEAPPTAVPLAANAHQKRGMQKCGFATQRPALLMRQPSCDKSYNGLGLSS